MSKLFTLTVNDQVTEVQCEEDAALLYILRNDLSLNGPKFGCGLGQCGACTVLLDGVPTRSCVTPIGAVGGAPVTTLDGLATGRKAHALQAAFVEAQAAQCGYCTNGMIMTAKALLDHNRDPDENTIKTALSANLCRCGIHNRIVRAVQIAAQKLAQ